MKPEKFKKLLITFIIIQKGISTKEILELVFFFILNLFFYRLISKLKNFQLLFFTLNLP